MKITPEAFQHALDLIIQKTHDIIPTEINRQLVSEWAESNRVLKEGNFQGPFSFDFTPYLREIADSLSACDPCREVVVLKGTRMGATVGIGENFIGYTIGASPGEMAYITSAGDMAEAQMDLRIDSLINSSGIGGKIGATDKRKGQQKTGDKTTRKVFPGGYIMAGGPKAPFIKRAFGFEKLYVDEIDSFPDTIDKEGDPTLLYRRRVDGYPDSSKILWTSTPLFKHNSKVTKLYKDGDQRKYFVECKHCGEMQFLRWGKKGEPGGLKFDHDDDDRLICEMDRDGKIKSSSVRYECEKCGGEWKNEDKDIFLQEKGHGGTAEWRPTAVPRQPGMKSYHLPGLYSPVGFRSWESAVIEFLNIKHRGFPPLEFQNWINTFLGEAFEDRGERPKLEALLTRNRTYKKGTLPEDAEIYFLTLGADIQKDRIECEIVAWGHDKRSWSINYHVIPGDTSDLNNECWEGLRSIIKAEHAGHKITLSGVDSGFRTDIVYQFCDTFKSNVFPVMGTENLTRGRDYIKFFPVSGHRVDRVNINTDLLKQEIYSSLAKGAYEDGTTPPDYCNFPMDYDRQHFNRLTAENRVLKTTGTKKYIWSAGARRNEQLDIRVYALAMVYAYRDAAETYLKEAKIIDEELNFTWEIFWNYVKSEMKKKNKV